MKLLSSRGTPSAATKPRPQWLRKIGASALALGVAVTGVAAGASAASAEQPGPSSNRIEWEPVHGIHGSIASSPSTLIEGVPTTVDYVVTLRNDTDLDRSLDDSLGVSVFFPVIGHEDVEYPWDPGVVYREPVYAEPVEGSASVTSSPERTGDQSALGFSVGASSIGLSGSGRIYAGETITLRYQVRYDGERLFESRYCVLNTAPDDPEGPDNLGLRAAAVPEPGWDGSCISHEVPIVPPAEAVPVAPALAAAEACGVEAAVTIPETEGVVYAQSRDGHIVTVTATTEAGYVFAEGSETEWTFEIPDVVPCDETVTPVAPALGAEPVCGAERTVVIPEQQGVVYTEARDGSTVTVAAAAAEGYVLAEGARTSWTFDVSAEACPPELAEATPLDPRIDESTECGIPNTLVIPEVEGVVYTVGEADEKGDFTITAAAKDGYVIAEGATVEWAANLGTVEECGAPEEPATPEEPTEEPVVTGVKRGAVTGDPLSGSNAGLAGVGALLLAGAGAAAAALVRRRIEA